MTIRSWTAALALGAGLWASGVATQSMAADADSNYIVRGYGGQPCQAYLTAVTSSIEEVQPYLVWMEGYISGVNRLQTETFDASPIIPSADMGQLVATLCQQSPDAQFERAVLALLELFKPYRIREQSQLIEMTVGDTSGAIRQETMRWMQEKMIEKGFFTATPDGRFGPDTQLALRAYQRARELPVTGVPDGETIVNFIREDIQAPGTEAAQ
ncbi:MAG: peptidoglycan-binding domain-containing protein [Alphaproteobacteria bacterium]